eukprot:NODE_1606_length_796_cov_76.768311_g1557_i0.p1 GENE.NODE_1606_length_796_cov_76.768311_g1557_i0~~NODE_1606_length_796_cov_76.768311_g1557_i0.p1  ORF type:complete len:210 (+),score=28.16 NODE_1606_length_796_cov_76.768311_g1557_i0:116-745(+)
MLRGVLVNSRLALAQRSVFMQTQAKRSLSKVLQYEEAERAHAVGTTSLWKNISLFFAVPLCGFLGYKIISDELGHEKHVEHVKYGTYISVRNKEYPWGDGNKTLFFNDHVNENYSGEQVEASSSVVSAAASGLAETASNLAGSIRLTPESDEERREKLDAYLAKKQETTDALVESFKRSPLIMKTPRREGRPNHFDTAPLDELAKDGSK